MFEREAHPTEAFGPDKSIHLLYHELTVESSAYSYSLTSHQFASHLDAVCRALAAPKEYLTPVLTFDDGHISHHEVALTELAKRGLVATFFVTVGWIGTREGYLSWDRLRAIVKAGHRVGAHGWSHCYLTSCGSNQLSQELKASKALLEERLGTEIDCMSFPGGRFNRSILQECRRIGFKRLYTSVPEVADASAELVGRINVTSSMSANDLLAILQRNSAALRRKQFTEGAKKSLRSLLGDSNYTRLWSVVTGYSRKG